MTDSLYLSVVKQLEKDDLVDSCLQLVSKVIILYICRFIGKRQYRKAIKTVLKGHKEQIYFFLFLKEKLDDHIIKNTLFKGIHAMSGYPRKTRRRYKMISDTLDLHELDLLWAVSTLTKEERAQIIKKRSTIPVHTPNGVDIYVKQVLPNIKKLCRTQLSFITNYDGGQDREDFVSDLSLHAVRLVRHYEVDDLEEEHMVKKIQRSLKNRVNNIAGAYGRPKKRVIERTHQKSEARHVWYLNPKKLCIKKVLISSTLSAREVNSSGRCKIHALFKKTGKVRFVWVDCLYSTKKEAEEARELIQDTGKRKRTTPLIDFNPEDLDDFRLTRTSLLQERGEDGFRLIDIIPDRKEDNNRQQKDAAELVNELEEVDKGLGIFAQLVTGETPHPLFNRYLIAKGRDVSILTPKQLGKQASQFLKIPLSDLKLKLLDTKNSLWTAQQKALIFNQVYELEANTI